MNNTGIIAEYNPFHKGHLHHLKESKKIGQADCIVAIMSGCFTQRGEPALYDKWVRAEMAVENGVDLVIELPFVFACNNAEYFAYGAIKILNDLGCITHLSFGSESGNISRLHEVAEFLAVESEDFKNTIKEFISYGYSYPRARSETVKTLMGDKFAQLIREPNNILAVEYLKQLIRFNIPIKPITVERLGKGYHDGDFTHPMASATAIRRKLSHKDAFEGLDRVVPGSTANIMKMADSKPVTDSEGLFNLLIYKVLTSSKEELGEIFSSTEGLENKLKESIIKNRSVKGIMSSVLSKRYNKTRINRLFIHTLTSLTKEEFWEIINRPALYARVLGFSQNGARLIRKIKNDERSVIPIITNINKEVLPEDPLWKVLKYDILAADIYNLLYNKGIYDRSDYVMRPYHNLKR